MKSSYRSMNSERLKEDKLLDSVILPPRPISEISSIFNGISRDSLMVYAGLRRIADISTASAKYFKAHSKYECQRAQLAVERLISRRARDTDQQRNKNQGRGEQNDFDERSDEKQALDELIHLLQAFLVEVNKDVQPYMEEQDIDELWTLVGSCDVAMEDGDSTKCYEIMGRIHEELVDAIRMKSRRYMDLVDVMERLSGKLEEAKEGA
ncbi:hypothetical protein BDZ45DRAFT_752856 [Acephala macrosclerotiorum]|nr:hypothetical protein BDZ45DRAFT_752856 [Acephala macrosclerotiorum]